MSTKRRWRSCESKRAFYTSREANRAARQWGHRSYQCLACNRWHLTSK